MSSAPAEPKAPKQRRPFEPWRKVMLLGAFILLAQALYVALSGSELPQWASMFLNFMGYGFLVAGFGMKMRDRKEAETGEAKVSEKGEKP